MRSALGVRGKLFAVSILVLVGVVLPSGLLLASEIREWMLERSERELARAARTARAVIHAHGGAVEDDWDALADRLGTAGDVRITIVSDGGRVLGDSELSGAEIASADNHADRPEIVRALASGFGSSTRPSATLGADMIYVAVPLAAGDSAGTVRAARLLSDVNAAIARARLFVVAVGALGIVVAALMSGLASHFMGRTLRTLVDSARAIAGGRARRIELSRGDELGGIAGSLNQMADELETTVEALARERARFALVLEGMSDAVIALDDDRHVTLMNSAAVTLLGLDGPGTGRPLIELVRAPPLQELTGNLPAQGASVEFELARSKKLVLARAAPQRGAPGTVIVMHDVTEIRRLETVRRDFVANVSHELRTPVSVIRANAETLRDGAIDDPEASRPLLDALHRNGERLAQLVADLLDLSRLEAGRYRLDRARIPVREAAERARELVDASAQDRGTRVMVDVPDDAVARADAKALEQILTNLLENAVKYSGDRARIAITGSRCGGEVSFEVRDNGPGIAPADRSRLFERFYRVDPGRSRDVGGTGLGLSIVKHLVESMGGRVTVEPADPRGSIFRVTLPADEPARA